MLSAIKDFYRKPAEIILTMAKVGGASVAWEGGRQAQRDGLNSNNELMMGLGGATYLLAVSVSKWLKNKNWHGQAELTPEGYYRHYRYEQNLEALGTALITVGSSSIITGGILQAQDDELSLIVTLLCGLVLPSLVALGHDQELRGRHGRIITEHHMEDRIKDENGSIIPWREGQYEEFSRGLQLFNSSFWWLDRSLDLFMFFAVTDYGRDQLGDQYWWVAATSCFLVLSRKAWGCKKELCGKLYGDFTPPREEPLLGGVDVRSADATGRHRAVLRRGLLLYPAYVVAFLAGDYLNDQLNWGLGSGEGLMNMGQSAMAAGGLLVFIGHEISKLESGQRGASRGRLAGGFAGGYGAATQDFPHSLTELTPSHSGINAGTAGGGRKEERYQFLQGEVRDGQFDDVVLSNSASVSSVTVELVVEDPAKPAVKPVIESVTGGSGFAQTAAESKTQQVAVIDISDNKKRVKQVRFTSTPVLIWQPLPKEPKAMPVVTKESQQRVAVASREAEAKTASSMVIAAGVPRSPSF